jgi:PAS domain S-box-containing protein
MKNKLLHGRWNVGNRLELILISGVLMLLLLEIASYFSAAEVERSNAWVEHTYVVLTKLQNLDANLSEAESACRAYVQDGAEAHLHALQNAIEESKSCLVDLRVLTADNPLQQADLAVFQNYEDDEVRSFELACDHYRKAGGQASQAVLASPDFTQLDRRVASLLRQMTQAERQLLIRREADMQRGQRYNFIFLTSATIAAVLMALLGATSIRNYLRERDRAIDATERANALNASILNTVQEGIYGVYPSGEAWFVNSAAAAMTGYTADEMIGKQMHQLIHTLNEDGSPHDWETCPLRRAKTQGVVERASNEVFNRRDGSRFPVDFTSVPMHDAKGVHIGQIVTFRDITISREVQRLKDQFIGMVSHELRTPLTSIRGSLGLLASGKLGAMQPKAQHMLDIAVNNTDRLVRLINDILDVERMESGKVSMEKRPCATEQLLRQAAENVGGLGDKSGVRITLMDSYNGTVAADPDRIVQTLTNLLGNAIKFSPRDTTVRLGCDLDGSSVRFWVRDEGRGIPKDKLDSIFDRFQQVDSSDARDKGGTGLGLAICRLIVHQHGGQIWVESEVDKGSTFYFTLPLASSPDIEKDERPLVALCGLLEKPLEVMARQLQTHGYDTLLSPGLDTLLQSPRTPSVILLHLSLVGDVGLDTVRQTPRLQHVPVIWFNGLSGHEQAERTLGAEVSVAHDEEALLDALAATLATPRDVADVLIVEDDPDLAAVLDAMFNRQGIRTHRATSGRSAIRLMADLVPNLIVLDLVMPEGDGFEVIEWMRQQDRLTGTTLLVYTAKDLTAEDMTRLNRHKTDVFTKSRISPTELEKYVLAALGQPAVEPSQPSA